MDQIPAVTVVIPNWNGRNLLPRCLSSLKAQTFRDFDVVLVDNGSVDGSCEYIESDFPEIRIIRLKENTGFANACNVGIEAANSRHVALLNNDTEAKPRWLENLMTAILESDESVACASSKMLRMDNPSQIDDAGDYLTWRGAAFKRGHGQAATNFGNDQEVMLPCAGASVYRRSVLNDLGGFDTRFFAYLEDVDLGLRIRLRGYRCIYVAGAEILHKGHGSEIPTPLYVFLTTRNRGFVFLKNIPWILLVKRLPSLTYGWLFFLVVHRGRGMYWRGTMAILKNIPYLLKKRREQTPHTVLTNAEIDALLANPWPEVTIGTLIKREYARLRSTWT